MTGLVFYSTLAFYVKDQLCDPECRAWAVIAQLAEDNRWSECWWMFIFTVPSSLWAELVVEEVVGERFCVLSSIDIYSNIYIYIYTYLYCLVSVLTWWVLFDCWYYEVDNPYHTVDGRCTYHVNIYHYTFVIIKTLYIISELYDDDMVTIIVIVINSGIKVC